MSKVEGGGGGPIDPPPPPPRLRVTIFTWRLLGLRYSGLLFQQRSNWSVASDNLPELIITTRMVVALQFFIPVFNEFILFLINMKQRIHYPFSNEGYQPVRDVIQTAQKPTQSG